MENYHYVLLFVFIFGITFFLIPKIRYISLKFNLTDTPDSRSSHTVITPSFGGVAFYISYLLALFFSQFFFENTATTTLLVSISILFFTGLLDDLLNLSAKVKFLGQCIGVGLLMFHSDFRILSLHGFMGITQIPLALSVTGSMFFLLGLINAFNLLDGIDGLTAITGSIVAMFYSYLFYHLKAPFYVALCVTTIAVLLAFLRFNFSVRKKIFMGDTGSLTLGLVLGLSTLKIMTLDYTSEVALLQFDPKKLPIFLIAVLFVPILDIFRVILIRFLKGVSIFKPDRNHMHHILVDYGLSHRRASFFIGIVNFIVALCMFFVIQNTTLLQSFLVLVLLFVIAIVILFLMNKNKTAIRLKLQIRRVLLRIHL